MKHLITAAVALSLATVAQADIFGFDTVTTNSSFNSATASQLFMETDVLGIGSSSVTFTNIGPLASSITEIYFGSDQALNLNLDSILMQCPGVDFNISGANPKNPPGMDDFGNWWTITIAAAEAASPPSMKGINPYECLSLEVSYDGALTFSELVQFGQLQVALHVTGQADGDSDTFVSGSTAIPEIVPEPASAILIGVSGVLITFVRKRFI